MKNYLLFFHFSLFAIACATIPFPIVAASRQRGGRMQHVLSNLFEDIDILDEFIQRYKTHSSHLSRNLLTQEVAEKEIRTLEYAKTKLKEFTAYTKGRRNQSAVKFGGSWAVWVITSILTHGLSGWLVIPAVYEYKYHLSQENSYLHDYEFLDRHIRNVIRDRENEIERQIHLPKNITRACRELRLHYLTLRAHERVIQITLNERAKLDATEEKRGMFFDLFFTAMVGPLGMSPKFLYQSIADPFAQNCVIELLCHLAENAIQAMIDTFYVDVSAAKRVLGNIKTSRGLELKKTIAIRLAEDTQAAIKKECPISDPAIRASVEERLKSQPLPSTKP